MLTENPANSWAEPSDTITLSPLRPFEAGNLAGVVVGVADNCGADEELHRGLPERRLDATGQFRVGE